MQPIHLNDETDTQTHMKYLVSLTNFGNAPIHLKDSAQ